MSLLNKMADIIRMSDKAKDGQPAWYNIGQHQIAHYVPESFNPEEDIPRTICKRNPTIMRNYPLTSGEIEDPEDPEWDEWAYKMCRQCMRKLKND